MFKKKLRTRFEKLLMKQYTEGMGVTELSFESEFIDLCEAS